MAQKRTIFVGGLGEAASSSSYAPARLSKPSSTWRPQAAEGLRLCPTALAAGGGLARHLSDDGENGDRNAGAGVGPGLGAASADARVPTGLLSACPSLGIGTVSGAEGADLSGFMTRWVDLNGLTSPIAGAASEAPAPAPPPSQPPSQPPAPPPEAAPPSIARCAAACATASGVAAEPPSLAPEELSGEMSTSPTLLQPLALAERSCARSLSH